MTIDQRVTRKLNALLKVYGTQEKVAAYLNVTQSYVSELLRGSRQPGPELLKRLGLTKRITYTETQP